MVDVDLPPQPEPDPDTEGYWSAMSAGVLSLARCEECARWVHPPTERCAACGGGMRFEPVVGTGTVYSFITVHQPSVPGYLRDLPYRVVLVELDDQPGLRLPGGIDAHFAEIGIGDRVSVELVDLPGGPYKIPHFRPI